jgi:Na+:H+ antiporter, NhaA family
VTSDIAIRTSFPLIVKDTDLAMPTSEKKILGFLPQEAVPGAILVVMAIAAMLVVNSPAGPAYKAFLETPFSIGPTGGGIEMKIAYWIKNGLMAVFFFFVGLELKREVLEGQLSNPAAAILPVLAAAGGMAVPALFFVGLAGGAGYAHGWAIPAATDIAFALGVLSLLGNRVPPALKAFLLAVAVVDDLGAIVIVAFFYTDTIAIAPLVWAGAAIAVLLILNRLKVSSVGVYVLVGTVLWVFMQQSGVSPTLAGVVVAMCVPMIDSDGQSPLHEAEHDFRPWVLFGVMPVFAFANAGVPLAGAGNYLTHPITLGAAVGLALGKPIGITLMALAGAWLMKARLPGTVPQVLGVACIAGIGFTMSLFVGALAFKDPDLATPVRLGVYAGSIASAVLGLLILSRVLPASVPADLVAQDDEASRFLAPDPDYEAHDRAAPKAKAIRAPVV